ncbi:class I SAM-dependent methyltransferase [Luminiphilus sp.]|nr:class I SAM-dependent methyltransferase [Luminiphilus sp.]
MTSGADGWDTFWRSSSTSEVLVTDTGARNPALDAFWASTLQRVTPQQSVVDIGCGAGSLSQGLVRAPALLVGVDISFAALTRSQSEASSMHVVQAMNEQLPFQPGSFDLVVSQFGVEYGGIVALAEACALVSPGGVLRCLVHCADSAIQQSAHRDLQHIEVLVTSEFFAAARSLTLALAAKDQQQLDAASGQFTESEQAVRAAVEIDASHFAGYSYLGFQSLLRRWARFEPDDILLWLTRMEQEADQGAARLRTMRSAAITDAKWRELTSLLSQRGLPSLHRQPVHSSETNHLIGWEVSQTTL